MHRFSSGWAAPSFLALFLGCLYLWFVVLRIPKLGEELAEAWPTEAELKPPPVETPEIPPKPPTAPTTDAAAATPAPAKAMSASAAVPMSEAEVAAMPMQLSAEELENPEVEAEDEEKDIQSDGEVPIADKGVADASIDAASEEKEENALEDDMVDAEKAQQLRVEGNEHFKAGRLHDAREAYSEALHVSPPAGEPGSDPSKDRAVLHCNRAACLQRLERWDDVVKDCSQAIKLDPTYVKAFARRSVANEELQKWQDAFEDLKKSLELDPSLRSKESRRITILEKRAQEQFEKDKDEMLSKLKDLGNTVLGKFGMSTDNFKLEQDPDTGSYSIKFQN